MLKKTILASVSALALIVDASATTVAEKTDAVKKDKKPAAVTISNKTESMRPIENVSTASASQVPAGVYVSGQVGYADTNIKSKTPAGILDNDGISGRIALGYKVMPNLGVEVGFLQLPDGKTVAPSNAVFSSHQYALDIAGKGILPITHTVNVYGKVGVAYLTTNLYLTKGTDRTSFNDEVNIAQHKLAPEVAVGMSYDVTQNMNVDASLTHIHPLGNKRPGNIDFLALGVGYTFG